MKFTALDLNALLIGPVGFSLRTRIMSLKVGSEGRVGQFDRTGSLQRMLE